MMTGGEIDIGNPAVFAAQLAGVATLLGAGYKITEDMAAKGERQYDEEDKGEVDIFRDTPVRYLGYANECGEAFRPLIPGYIVALSYAVAIAYVSADAIFKGYQCANESKPNFKGSSSTICAFPACFDVLLFQMLASVIFPGFTINRWVTLVAYAERALHLQDSLPPLVFEWAPTIAGLGLIPFIVKPLDNLVERALDITLRPIIADKFPLCELEPIFGAEPLP